MWRTFNIFIFAFLWTYLAIGSPAGPYFYENNWGHRGGKSKKYFKDLPENSLILLEHALKGGPYGRSTQHHLNFKYLEFDVRETLDGHLVIFHDKYLARMVPNRTENNKVYQRLLSNTQFIERTGYRKYKDFQISDLTLEEIKRFHLRNSPDQSIPTLEEYLSHIRQFGLQKPIAIDIKNIQTDKAKYLLTAIATNFLKEYLHKIHIVFEYDYQMIGPLTFLASPWAFKQFVHSENQVQRAYFELSNLNEYIPVFYKGRHKGYVLTVEQNLLFLNEERSTTSPDRPEAHTIYQEPLSQCASALH